MGMCGSTVGVTMNLALAVQEGRVKEFLPPLNGLEDINLEEAGYSDLDEEVPGVGGADEFPSLIPPNTSLAALQYFSSDRDARSPRKAFATPDSPGSYRYACGFNAGEAVEAYLAELEAGKKMVLPEGILPQEDLETYRT